jgi:endonuclease YncB( thermonuclease family)
MRISTLAKVMGGLVALAAACATGGSPSGAPFGDRAPGPIPSLEEVARRAPPMPCQLVRWEDGDTPYVRCSEGGPEVAVRMLGIDTAESAFDEQSRARGERQARQWGMSLAEVFACGQAATLRARELCPEGSPVEVTSAELDRYGRRLGYVVCAGVNLNARLVEEGLAGRFPYPGPPEKPARCPLAP